VSRAILWFALFYRSRYVRRWFAGWGLVSISVVTVAVLLAMYDPHIDVPTFLELRYAVFEGVIGPWLIIRGIRAPAQAA
jgi:hypothetical protein